MGGLGIPFFLHRIGFQRKFSGGIGQVGISKEDFLKDSKKLDLAKVFFF